MGQTLSVSTVDDEAARVQRYRREGWWPDEALVTRFHRLVAAAPGASAVADDRGRSLTRAGLWAQAGGIAAEFGGRGVVEGDVVLVCLPNRVEWQAVFLACLRLGVVPATVPATTDAATLGYVSRLIGARVLVGAATHGQDPTGEQAVAAARSTGNAVDVLLVADDGEYSWTAVPGEPPAVPAGPPGLHHLMFTSSTTGRPKAVAHTENTLAAVNQGFAQRFSITDGRPIFMPSPMGHSVGAWHGGRLSLFTGAALILQDRWDPERAIETIGATRSQLTVAATPFLKDLIDVGRPGGMAGLGTFLSGGAPVPPALLERAMDQLPQTLVSVLWGMTEGGVTTCVPGDGVDRILGTAGTGLPGLELRILGGDGEQAAPGTTGELAMRGPGVFTGYLGQDSLYRELMTADGFFRTGDLAELDGDGYLRLTGRLKDLIIRGGVNISPAPLENELAAHPRIGRVAVIGLPDDRLGERICAVIVADGDPPELDGLLEWLRQRGLPRRQWPERLCVVAEMPQTALGKIRKLELRDRILQELA